MEINCPNCHQQYEIEEEQIGLEAECIQCKCSFIIEHPNLIKCPACDRIVSREASTCPTCGHSIKKATLTLISKAFNNSNNIISSTSDSLPKQNIKEIDNSFLHKDQPHGIGGWLLLFCIILTILSPLLSFAKMSSDWEASSKIFSYYPFLKNASIWECSGVSGILIFGIFVGILIWKGNTNGKQLAKNYLLARFFGYILIELFSLYLIKDLPTEMFNYMLNRVISVLLAELIIFTVWWLYFMKSKRVKNTYNAYNNGFIE